MKSHFSGGKVIGINHVHVIGRLFSYNCITGSLTLLVFVRSHCRPLAHRRSMYVNVAPRPGIQKNWKWGLKLVPNENVKPGSYAQCCGSSPEEPTDSQQERKARKK